MNSKKTHFYNCSFIYFKIFKIFNSFIFILLYMFLYTFYKQFNTEIYNNSRKKTINCSEIIEWNEIIKWFGQ